MNIGAAAVLKFIRLNNYTRELDEDIFQEAMLTAYLEVERGHYIPREGIPFTAYVKGIARNKIREARRRERGRKVHRGRAGGGVIEEPAEETTVAKAGR